MDNRVISVNFEIKQEPYFFLPGFGKGFASHIINLKNIPLNFFNNQEEKIIRKLLYITNILI